MRNLIIKIVSNRIKYNNTIGIVVIGQFLILIGLYTFIFNRHEYKSAHGRVDKIKMGYFLTERTSTFETKKQYKKEVGIEINLNNNLFYIDKNEKDKWNEILRKIEIGDTIRILYYHFADRNLNNIHQLEIEGEKLLTIEERNKPLKYVIGSMISLFILTCIFLFVLIRKRKFYK